MEERKITKLEFLLSLEDHIVCQRFFNVKGFKPSNLRSLDLYELIEEIQLDVQQSLKMKATDYLMDNYNRYTHTVNLSEQDRNPQVKEYPDTRHSEVQQDGYVIGRNAVKVSF